MSKVKKEIVEAAILKLITQISQTMPNTMYQFVFGGATTFMTMKGTGKINDMLQLVSDDNGLVDVDILEKLIEGAFKASNNKVQVELFNQPGFLSMFIKPLTVTIQKQDIDDLIKEIKANSTANEVTISTQVEITK